MVMGYINKLICDSQVTDTYYMSISEESFIHNEDWRI